jgi:hypothetical protein
VSEGVSGSYLGFEAAALMLCGRVACGAPNGACCTWVHAGHLLFFFQRTNTLCCMYPATRGGLLGPTCSHA